MGVLEEEQPLPELEQTTEFTLEQISTALGSTALKEALTPEQRVASAERLLGSALEHQQHGFLGLARNHLGEAVELLQGIRLVNGSVLLLETIYQAWERIEAEIATHATNWPRPEQPGEESLEARRQHSERWAADFGEIS